MEIKSFPNNRDEYIGAEYVMRWLHGRTSGVFGAANNAAVQAAGGMAVTVSDGVGWIANASQNGIVWWNSNEAENGEKLSLIIDQADTVLNRLDRIIVEWKTINYAELPEIKILKGTPSSAAAPPALTNNSTLRQLSLARVSVAAGTTAITASMITDERLDASVCGIVTEAVSVDTSMINSQVSTMLTETTTQAKSVLDSISKELSDLEAGTAVELKKLVFADTTVPVSAFVANSTYQDYPFRAAVTLANVIASMIPNVVYSVAALTDNNFAPVAECYNGGVYIYSDSKPTNPVAIDTIICWKGGNAE